MIYTPIARIPINIGIRYIYVYIYIYVCMYVYYITNDAQCFLVPTWIFPGSSLATANLLDSQQILDPNWEPQFLIGHSSPFCLDFRKVQWGSRDSWLLLTFPPRQPPLLKLAMNSGLARSAKLIPGLVFLQGTMRFASDTMCSSVPWSSSPKSKKSLHTRWIPVGWFPQSSQVIVQSLVHSIDIRKSTELR